MMPPHHLIAVFCFFLFFCDMSQFYVLTAVCRTFVVREYMYVTYVERAAFFLWLPSCNSALLHPARARFMAAICSDQELIILFFRCVQSTYSICRSKYQTYVLYLGIGCSADIQYQPSQMQNNGTNGVTSFSTNERTNERTNHSSSNLVPGSQQYITKQ